MFRVNSVGKLNLANLLAPAVGLQELWKYQRQCTGTKKKNKKTRVLRTVRSNEARSDSRIKIGLVFRLSPSVLAAFLFKCAA